MRTERSRNVGASSSPSLQNTALLNPTSTRMHKAPIFLALNHSSATVFNEKDGLGTSTVIKRDKCTTMIKRSYKNIEYCKHIYWTNKRLGSLRADSLKSSGSTAVLFINPLHQRALLLCVKPVILQNWTDWKSLIKSREITEWDSLKSIHLHCKNKVYKAYTNTKFTQFYLSLF